MKKVWISCLPLLVAGVTTAQVSEGRVVYERTAEMRISINGGPSGGPGPEIQQMLPKTRTDMLEVLFSNNQSIKRTIPPEENNDQIINSTNGQNGGMVVRTVLLGVDDVVFTNLGEGRIVEQREFAANKYLVMDTVKKLNWKITGETKSILGYTCQQAVAQRIGMRMQMGMVNGELKRGQLTDTSVITAWFTSAIPVSAGPDLQGQLPGLILALDFNNGKTVYKATEFSPKVKASEIKEPKNGKKVSQKEFAAERDKVMQEMEKNGGLRFRRDN